MNNTERDLQHFAGRLEKDSYSKEDVAKLLHSEAQFTAQKTRGEFADYVSRSEYDTITSANATLKAELAPYKEAEWNGHVSSAFADLNGNSERTADFIKLSGLSVGSTPEEIKAKAVELKESGNYEFLFKSVDSGSAAANPATPVSAPAGGMIVPKTGLAQRLFKK